MPILACFIAILASFGMSCKADPDALTWKLKVDDALLARAASINARILAGGCDGEQSLYSEYAAVGTRFSVRPPILPRGRYGFYAQLISMDCFSIAEGCTEANLPSDGTVEVTLLEREPFELCNEAICNQGVCLSSPPKDAGSGALDDASTSSAMDSGGDI
ncbi:MAG: hypothetical protein IPJ88_04055 [Myxococcales bacterium]|nr:MAG: hypothetical protein IPJ88_04055 [Myxococcales bacterium]